MKSSVSKDGSYFLGDKECDFVIQSETGVNDLIQVCWEMKDKQTREREIDGIREAASITGCGRMTIVTRDLEEDVPNEYGTIHIVPAWKWFLDK